MRALGIASLIFCCGITTGCVLSKLTMHDGDGGVGGNGNEGGSTSSGVSTGGNQLTVGGMSSQGEGGSSVGTGDTSANSTGLGGTQPSGGGVSNASNTASGGAIAGSAVASGGAAQGGAVTGGVAGTTLTGGVGTIGGTMASAGGATVMGGSVATGGVATTGGIPSIGGTTSAVDTGDAVSTGGAATGGAVSTGGAATGGVASTGGTVSTGGAATGGATFCTITSSSGAVIYQNGAPNSANACQVCDVTKSTEAWYALPEGANCGTGGGTVCHAGACIAGCWIASTYYATGASNPNGLCQSCKPTALTTDWTPDGAGASCGCTGTLETVQSGTWLCVAKMAAITAPSASWNYNIDVTEVTKGQYDQWLGTKPALPASTDAKCGYVTSYAEQGTVTGDAHHPVVYVDWCDAYAYCKGVGKRLCGGIGGGANAYASSLDATLSQWYRACSSGGTNTYPYGSTYQASYCDGADYRSGTDQTVVVGSLPSCVTSAMGYAGVYDLSGNVWEWEDSCSDTGQSATCRVRGGAFYDDSSGVTCGNVGIGTRYYVYNYFGFRCCSP